MAGLVKSINIRSPKPTIGECLLIVTMQPSDRKTQMSNDRTAKCPRLIQIKDLGESLRHFGNIG